MIGTNLVQSLSFTMLIFLTRIIDKKETQWRLEICFDGDINWWLTYDTEIQNIIKTTSKIFRWLLIVHSTTLKNVNRNIIMEY